MPHPLTDRVIDFLHSEPRFRPVDELRLHIDGHAAGWVRESVADALCRLRPGHCRRTAAAGPEAFPSLHLQTGSDHTPDRVDARSRFMQALALELREAGLLQNWRGENMQLDHAGRPFLVMERAAFRTLGLRTPSVHLNGWVCSPDGMLLWVAERSHHKFVDPGRLDNLVGGGLSAGEDLAEGLAREAWEEAGLHFRRVPAPSAWLHVSRRIGEGLQDELVAIHDVWLPPHFSATNQDGEVAHAGVMPVGEALPLLLAGRFTWDAGLVVIDGLLRQHHFGFDGSRRIAQTLAGLGYRDDCPAGRH